MSAHIKSGKEKKNVLIQRIDLCELLKLKYLQQEMLEGLNSWFLMFLEQDEARDCGDFEQNMN
jgi:hypothetical protein